MRKIPAQASLDRNMYRVAARFIMTTRKNTITSGMWNKPFILELRVRNLNGAMISIVATQANSRMTLARLRIIATMKSLNRSLAQAQAFRRG